MFGVGCQDLLALYRRYRYPDWTFESGHFHNNFIQIDRHDRRASGWRCSCSGWRARRPRCCARCAPRPLGPIAAWRPSALGLMAALIVSGMFDYTFGDAEVVYHTFLALGFALALAPGRAGRHRAPPA